MSTTPIIDTSAPTPQPRCAAASLSPAERQALATQALAGATSVAELARQHQVSRKFVDRQVDQAGQALDQAFDPDPEDPTGLFWLPVTGAWLRQLVLALVLICHASIRGVVELLQEVFDTSISEGTVSNILHQTVAQVRSLHAQEDLSAIRTGAHDEIFQSRQPILVGCDVASTYCYLLTQEDNRNANTWGVHLLDLQARGLQLEQVIADGGSRRLARGALLGRYLPSPQRRAPGDHHPGTPRLGGNGRPRETGAADAARQKTATR